MNSRLSPLLALRSQLARPIRPESLSINTIDMDIVRCPLQDGQLIADSSSSVTGLGRYFHEGLSRRPWLALLTKGAKKKKPRTRIHRGFSEWCSAA